MTLELDPYAQMLYTSDPLRLPVTRQMIAVVDPPPGSRGLDLGCGIGLQALRLARAVGDAGAVVGVDASARFVEVAGELAASEGLTARATFRQGDWARIPGEDAEFDWAWSVDAAGYAPGDTLAALRELARVVKPGGKIALAFWSSQMLLPGFPALEARLNASQAGVAPFSVGARPEQHYLRMARWMRAAGLENVRAHTFAGDVQAPLPAGMRAALALLFEMRWGSAAGDLSPEDWTEFQRLCRTDSPDCVLNLPDYYAFFTYTLFTGLVPA